jgi:hypothetical protein
MSKTMHNIGGYASFFVTKAEVSENGKKGIDKRGMV